MSQIGDKNISIEEMEVQFENSSIENPFGNLNPTLDNSVNIINEDSRDGVSNSSAVDSQNNALDNSQAKESASHLSESCGIGSF